MNVRISQAPLSRLSFESLQWTFPVAVTLHNLEEAIWLPSWAAQHSALLPWHLSAGLFRVAAAAVALAAYPITLFSLQRGRRSAWTSLFVAFAFTMFLNVFVPHVPATIFLRSYTPGVVTAVLLILPVTTLLLMRALKEKVVTGVARRTAVIAIPLILATIAGLLFAAKM